MLGLVASSLFSLILMKPLGAMGLALAGSIGGWVLFILTVREVGTDKFMHIIRSKKSLYFMLSMVIFGFMMHTLNQWLITLIR